MSPMPDAALRNRLRDWYSFTGAKWRILCREFISAKTLDNKEYVASLIKIRSSSYSCYGSRESPAGIINIDDIVDVIDEKSRRHS